MKIEKKDKVKLVVLIVVVVLAVTIFFQNTETVETRILLLTVMRKKNAKA